MKGRTIEADERVAMTITDDDGTTHDIDIDVMGDISRGMKRRFVAENPNRQQRRAAVRALRRRNDGTPKQFNDGAVMLPPIKRRDFIAEVLSGKIAS